ncbi:hypothetical protein MMC25_005086 [Agyrium rufum]|nr:hypothetical protein [Agyrium rufum]
MDNLPSEIRLGILRATTDLHTLSCLARASPNFHSTYHAYRETVYSHVLLRQLESTSKTSTDALITLRSSQLQKTADDNCPELTFLKHYTEVRNRSPSSRFQYYLQPKLALDQCLYIKKLDHISDILSEQFVAHVRATLDEPSMNQFFDFDTTSPLSMFEKRRFKRGIYRWQMRCNLFGRTASLPSEAARGSSTSSLNLVFHYTPEEEADGFLKFLTPWEVEELGTFCEFALALWAEMLIACVDRSDPSRRRCSPSARRYVSQEVQELRVMIEDAVLALEAASVLASQGPIFWYETSRITDSDAQMAAIARAVVKYKDYPTAFAAMKFPSDHGKQLISQRRNKSHAWLLASDEDENAPNLCWTISDSSVGHPTYVDERHEPLRALGYVLWDRERLFTNGEFQRLYEMLTKDAQDTSAPS